MTREQFEQAMDTEGDTFLSSRAKGCKVLAGLLILAKYLPDQELIGASAHDIIYGPDVDSLVDAGVTEADAAHLVSFGWMIDADSDSMAKFT